MENVQWMFHVVFRHISSPGMNRQKVMVGATGVFYGAGCSLMNSPLEVSLLRNDPILQIAFHPEMNRQMDATGGFYWNWLVSLLNSLLVQPCDIDVPDGFSRKKISYAKINDSSPTTFINQLYYPMEKRVYLASKNVAQ